MSELSFYRPAAKTQIAAAVKEVESKTAAEVEVAVRRVSGRYRDVDYLAGFALAVATLSVLLFHPRPWAVRTIPLDLVVAFVVGSTLCAHFWNVRRLLVPLSRQKARVREAGLATFSELGIARTHGRHGILVYVSLFERRVEVVPDIGVDVPVLGPGWHKCVEDMERALIHRHDLDAFCASLRSLGPVLAAAMPRTADSANELPDEPDSR